MDQLEEELIRTLRRIARLKFRLCVPGYSRGKFALLGVAWRIYQTREDHRIRVSDLVENMGVPAPAVSRTLKSLEEEGLLVRSLDPEDRRTTLVTFTEKGIAEIRECSEFLNAVLGEVVHGMGSGKVQQLCDLLNEMYERSDAAIRNYDSRSFPEERGQ